MAGRRPLHVAGRRASRPGVEVVGAQLRHLALDEVERARRPRGRRSARAPRASRRASRTSSSARAAAARPCARAAPAPGATMTSRNVSPSFDLEQRLGLGHAHARAEAAVQLEDDRAVERAASSPVGQVVGVAAARSTGSISDSGEHAGLALAQALVVVLEGVDRDVGADPRARIFSTLCCKSVLAHERRCLPGSRPHGESAAPRFRPRGDSAIAARRTECGGVSVLTRQGSPGAPSAERGSGPRRQESPPRHRAARSSRSAAAGFSMEAGNPLLDDYVLGARARASAPAGLLPAHRERRRRPLHRPLLPRLRRRRCEPSHVSLFRRDARRAATRPRTCSSRT